MKILAVSDTHRKHDCLQQIIEREKPFDHMLHMGDAEGCEYEIRQMAGTPLDIVAGNCDYFVDLPNEKLVRLEGTEFFITHGHGFYVNLGTQILADHARSRGARVALFGHTHRPTIESQGDVLVVNPGSISYPRQSDKKPSYAVIIIEENLPPQVEIKYL